jgi:hypothetical protein
MTDYLKTLIQPATTTDNAMPHRPMRVDDERVVEEAPSCVALRRGRGGEVAGWPSTALTLTNRIIVLRGTGLHLHHSGR